MKSFLVGAIFLCALTSLGVSRVGGGKVSSLSSQFEMVVPEPFSNLEQIDQMVIANGPLMGGHGIPTPLFLHIREFSDYYSDLRTLSRVELESYFLTRGFKKENLNTDPCLEIFSFENTTTTGAVATWGNGQGVTLTGANAEIVALTLRSALQSLVLNPGACAWKP